MLPFDRRVNRLERRYGASLFPSQGSSGFCQKLPAAGAPAFARVEDVPGDAARSTACLRGNTAHADSRGVALAPAFEPASVGPSRS